MFADCLTSWQWHWFLWRLSFEREMTVDVYLHGMKSACFTSWWRQITLCCPSLHWVWCPLSLGLSLFFATLSWEKRPWKEVKERWRDSLEVLTLCLVFPCVIHLVYNILYCLKFQAGQTESKVVVKKYYTRQERLLFSSRLFLLFVTSHFKQNPCLISLFNP